ncbi:glucose-6-phosphate isomerase [Parvularcula bermudensis HTCC2503]|uniref:Glucose-6-phosphate isomerase n=1 Tax=Parvularcula bermudensis (strain ATCC BAA-594 / HTCC2503 / KCTC 12087) TaxID=314260 RepID=E0TDH8_PARBH|nr:glucose-6-phosphate isomerase [Parvularcula bermudensis]ADM08733.1 glucose-6-phosphate isomerase [Parvularcula bermudensis HTCC2503]
MVTDPSARAFSWKKLTALAAEGPPPLSDLFDHNPGRVAHFSLEAAGVYADYSKTPVNQTILDALYGLARACDFEARRDAMFGGQRINETEERAVLHVALRDTSDRIYTVDGQNVTTDIHAVKDRMKAFVEKVHDGRHDGYGGAPLDTVVNIGIGGSDLGPAMVSRALDPYTVDGRRTFYVSNVDGADIASVLRQIDPERTLFLIASKTFTTQETMTNAETARNWFLSSGGNEAAIAKHFVALSTNEAAVTDFGIDPENMFAFWDWVGGRYSLWSAIGLSIALQIGWSGFEDLLSGARGMDRHFETMPLEGNLPASLALIDVWHRSFLGYSARAVLPYDQSLARLPAYLQQADMESLGKRIDRSGQVVDYPTGAIVFGEPGTNGQHAFYQLLHQGTDVIPCDFIAAACGQVEVGDHHEKLLANFLAQPEALMAGRSVEAARSEALATGKNPETADRLAIHRSFPGDRPTISLLVERLTPEALGALLALYEHRIFVQSILWDINAFDQWGVELGKGLAKTILAELEGEVDVASHDPSTADLIRRIKRLRREGGVA